MEQSIPYTLLPLYKLRVCWKFNFQTLDIRHFSLYEYSLFACKSGADGCIVNDLLMSFPFSKALLE